MNAVEIVKNFNRIFYEGCGDFNLVNEHNLLSVVNWKWYGPCGIEENTFYVDMLNIKVMVYVPQFREMIDCFENIKGLDEYEDAVREWNIFRNCCLQTQKNII